MKDRIKCLLCGKYFRIISWSHLKYIHGTDCQSYKELFNLDFVACDEVRILISDTERESIWNKQNIIGEIKDFYEKNKNFTRPPIPLAGAARHHFGSWRNAIVAAGFSLNDLGKKRSKTKEELLTELREMYSNGQLLTAKKMKKKRKVIYHLCLGYFGSFREAIIAAGIDYREFRRKTILKWDRDKIISEISRIKSSRIEDMPTGLYRAGMRIFGSWEKALEEADIEYGEFFDRHKKTKTELLDKIKEYESQGIALNSQNIQRYDHQLIAMCTRRFGSWENALMLVGIKYSEVRLDLRKYSNETIFTTIRDLHFRDELLTASKMKDHPKYSSLFNACINYIGSYKKAVELAGIDYAFLCKKNRKWNKDKVKMALREHLKGELTPIPSNLRSAIRKHFGSIPLAFDAIGVNHQFYLSEIRKNRKS